MQDILYPLTILPYLGQVMIVVMAILGLWFGSDKVVWGVKLKAIEPPLDVMEKLQRLVLDYPEILSININPVMVTENRAVCVDFKILVR